MSTRECGHHTVRTAYEGSATMERGEADFRPSNESTLHLYIS